MPKMSTLLWSTLAQQLADASGAVKHRVEDPDSAARCAPNFRIAPIGVTSLPIAT